MSEGAPTLTFEKPEEVRLENQKVLIEGLTPYESAKEFIDGKSEEVKEYARTEDVLHTIFYGELPENHETFVAVKKNIGRFIRKRRTPKRFSKVIYL